MSASDGDVYSATFGVTEQVLTYAGAVHVGKSVTRPYIDRDGSGGKCPHRCQHIRPDQRVVLVGALEPYRRRNASTSVANSL